MQAPRPRTGLDNDWRTRAHKRQHTGVQAAGLCPEEPPRQ